MRKRQRREGRNKERNRKQSEEKQWRRDIYISYGEREVLNVEVKVLNITEAALDVYDLNIGRAVVRHAHKGFDYRASREC